MQIGRNLRVALALATIAEGVAAWRAPKDERRRVVASLAVVAAYSACSRCCWRWGQPDRLPSENRSMLEVVVAINCVVPNA